MLAWALGPIWLWAAPVASRFATHDDRGYVGRSPGTSPGGCGTGGAPPGWEGRSGIAQRPRGPRQCRRRSADRHRPYLPAHLMGAWHSLFSPAAPTWETPPDPFPGLALVAQNSCNLNPSHFSGAGAEYNFAPLSVHSDCRYQCIGDTRFRKDLAAPADYDKGPTPHGR